jgi:uncharacterized 2Fe-2S/4Fe-4S cluster protein (DUF4445 family)
MKMQNKIMVRAGGDGDGQAHELAITDADCARKDGETLAGFLAWRGFPLNTRCGGRGLCKGCLVFADDAAEPVRACQVLLAKAAEGFSRVTIPQRSLLRQQPSVVDDFCVNIPMARDPIAPGARYGAAVDVGTTTVAALVCDLENGKVIARASGFNGQIKSGEDVLTRIQVCFNTGGEGVRALQHAVVAETIRPLIAEACAKAEAGTGGRVGAGDVGVVVIAGNTTMLHLVAGMDPSPMGMHPFTPGFLEHRMYEAGEVGLELGGGGNGAGAAGAAGAAISGVPEARSAHGVMRDDAGEGRGCTSSGDLGIAAPRAGVSRRTPVHLLPGLSAYVGADLTAGLVATGMIYEEGPALLVDVGTNGEIVAKVGGRLVGCATAAGPAFEGAGLLCGMRAARGAIERVRMGAGADGVFDMRLDVIAGNGASGAGAPGKPVGMCGSAYVDFLWEARRAGLLQENGRFVAREKLPPGMHVEAGGGGRHFRICERGASGALWVSEFDVVKLLQAKAAIGAGIQTLLGVLGITARDVKRLYLAGGFGMHLSLEHAIGCGLLPGFAPGQVEVVGNTSLAGAYLAMNDKSLLEEMENARRRFEAVELNLQPGFEDAYIDNLALE